MKKIYLLLILSIFISCKENKAEKNKILELYKILEIEGSNNKERIDYIKHIIQAEEYKQDTKTFEEYIQANKQLIKLIEKPSKENFIYTIEQFIKAYEQGIKDTQQSIKEFPRDIKILQQKIKEYQQIIKALQKLKN